MTVKDIIAICEYTGCIVVDQLDNKIPITKENMDEIYAKSVESVYAANNKVCIRTFDKLDQLQGLTEKDDKKFEQANPKWDNLMHAILKTIRDELDRLYWNKYQEEMDSPFDNTGASYANPTFTVRAYSWEEDDDQPNFECGPVRVYWYKHEGRDNIIETRRGFDSPAIYAIVLDKCLEALAKDFKEEQC